MAIAHSLKTSGATSAGYGTGSATTASFTPANNSLLVVFLGTVDNGAGDIAASLTIADSAGLTWTSRALTSGTTGNYRSRSRCWTAPVTTGQSMTITFDCGASSVYNYGWFVVEITGHDTSTPTGGTATSISTTADGALSMTLSDAPASGDYTLAAVWLDGDTTGTIGASPGTGFTEIGENGGTSSNAYGQCQYRTSSTSTTVAWADLRTGTMATYSHSAVALVIKAAATGGASASRPSSNSRDAWSLRVKPTRC